MDITELTVVVEQAAQAPSVHNTQPWRFRVSADAVEVWADRGRAVPVIDPTGRQLHISCGAAIEFTRLGIRARGHDCSVRLVPDTAEPDLLARIVTGESAAATADERSMVAAIPRRHTHRDPFELRPVPAELIEELRGQVSAAGAWLHVIHRPEDLITTAVLLAHAEQAELADPAYRAELARWVGVDPRAIEGIPTSALSSTPVEERGATLRLRDFQPAPAPGAGGGTPPAERPLIALVGTEADDRVSWLVAGQGLARLLLRAAAEDVYTSPLNQVLDQPGFRLRFARELGLLGFPQMLLRMGFAQPGGMTGRRRVVEVIDSMQPRTDGTSG